MKGHVIIISALLCLAPMAWGAGGTGSTTGAITLSMAVNQQYPIPNDSKYVQLMAKKYNITFDIWPCYGDEYINQVNMRLAAGEIPDVMNPTDLVELVKQDVIMEVKLPDVQSHMPRWWKELYSYSSSPFKYCKIGGAVYGLPGQSADGIYHFTVLWRSDWLKRLGIAKTPVTLAEAEKALYAFTTRDPDGNGKNDTYGLSNLGMLPVFGAFGPIPFNNAWVGLRRTEQSSTMPPSRP
jgi:putative aldouronate transport system substrate-binding protein